MTTVPVAMDHQLLHDALRTWHEREETLDDQLAESLAALEAYQSHLDAWQRDLAGERRTLERDREQLEADRATAKDATARLSKATDELNDARAQVASLSKTLLERTEELRNLDSQRAELTAELELVRAREREATARLESTSHEERPPQWAEELKQLRELLENQMDTEDVDGAMEEIEQADSTGDEDVAENPVLGSIVQQFGKLRQQRSQGQRSRKKTG